MISVEDKQGAAHRQVPGAEGRREWFGLSMIYKEELTVVLVDIMMLQVYALEAEVSVFLRRMVGSLDRKNSAEKVLGS